MPNLNGLLEAALFVEKLSRARDFYQQVVGLEKLQESEAGCVFVVAKGQLLLLISREKAKLPSKTPGGEVPPCLGSAGEALGAGHIAKREEEGEGLRRPVAAVAPASVCCFPSPLPALPSVPADCA
jgi:catechol 2,3-dioxygenase-like lactoylglutathione lyase family enzyme